MGETHMVMIVVILIGVIGAAGVIFIPRLTSNMSAQSCCSEQGGSFDKRTGTCSGGSMDGKTVSEMKRETLCQ